MLVRTRLPEIRKQRALSAADLARRVGVTRQTIYSIEDGTFVPNTAVALQLSRALNVTVEQLFFMADETVTDPVTADLLSDSETNQGQLVRVCLVNERLVAVPASFLPAYLPAADGVIESRTKSSVSIKSLAARPEGGKRLLLAGCDPALSVLAGAIHTSEIEIVPVPCASRRALQWLKQGRVHAAGSHLLDQASGDYNLPVIRRLLPSESVRVVTFAVWEQGLLLRGGNPKSIRSIADLAAAGVAIVNREKGSGSRNLLDSGLRQLGVHSSEINGYNSIAQGHLAAAYAVASGVADCCIAPRSAALCFGLTFIPLAVERFDLTFTQTSAASPAGKALLDLLNTSQLRQKLQCIAGYDTAHTGEVLM